MKIFKTKSEAELKAELGRLESKLKLEKKKMQRKERIKELKRKILKKKFYKIRVVAEPLGKSFKDLSRGVTDLAEKYDASPKEDLTLMPMGSPLSTEYGRRKKSRRRKRKKRR